MADPNLTNKIVIMLGDGEDPEVFSWPCGADVVNFTLTNNVGETMVIDCADPFDTIATAQRWVESQDTSLSISGRVDKASFAVWRAWADGAIVKNVRIFNAEALADGGGWWTLPAILQTFEGGRQDLATNTFSASIVAAGRRVWTNASA